MSLMVFMLFFHPPTTGNGATNCAAAFNRVPLPQVDKRSTFYGEPQNKQTQQSREQVSCPVPRHLSAVFFVWMAVLVLLVTVTTHFAQESCEYLTKRESSQTDH